MRIVDTATAREFACAAADWLCAHLHDKPASVLALPTGNSPRGLYSELIVRSKGGAVRLHEARVFNLDEYCGLTPTDPHSYAHFLRSHLIGPIGLRAAQVRLLRGDAPDLEAECRAYDAALAECGGVDACILGMGANGHIAFNEPGSPWNLATHVVRLSESTRSAHQRHPPAAWTTPEWGVTMGIQTLLQARRVLLLIAGAHKRAARAALEAGVATLDWPVTSLLTHPNVTVIQLCEPAGLQ